VISPRVEIDLQKIEHNARSLVGRLADRGISVTGVTKAVLGLPAVAHAMVDGGVARLGDSRITNLARLRAAGLDVPLMLLRSPTPQESCEVVALAETTLVSEALVIQALEAAAASSGRDHGVVLMVELGDLREGVMTRDVLAVARQVVRTRHLTLVGLGTNLACRSGVVPSEAQMSQLGMLAQLVREELEVSLPLVSGGNSANLGWALSPTRGVSGITDLRLGESILLGTDPGSGHPLSGLSTDAFTLCASVIESLEKPSKPWGRQAPTSFGAVPETVDVGKIIQTIVNIGRQDIDPDGLTLPADMTMLGTSSDHLVLRTRTRLTPGTELRFGLDYAALLRAMTSPFIAHQFILNAVPA
jgi:ornithine racemase